LELKKFEIVWKGFDIIPLKEKIRCYKSFEYFEKFELWKSVEVFLDLVEKQTLENEQKMNEKYPKVPFKALLITKIWRPLKLYGKNESYFSKRPKMKIFKENW